MATVQPRSPGGHRLAPEEIEHKKKAQALLEKTAQQAREMEILAHLSFQPRAQTWARDPPSVSAAERDQNDADPNLVSHVIILRRFEAWAESCRRQVIDLQKHLVKQFMTAGLFVCQLNAEKSSLDSYFGLYASPDALLEEKRNLMSENLLSWNGAGVADLPTAMFVSPAEKMLLTLRIINRCIDFIRISRDEDEGYTGKPGMLKRLGIWCRDSCGGEEHKLQNVKVQALIKDIFGLHCKRVRTQLFRLFAKEVRLFCCNSFKRLEMDDEGSDGNGSNHPTGKNAKWLSLRSDLPPFIEFCDELRYHYGSETAIFFAFVAFCFRQLILLSIVATPVSLISIAVDDAHATVLIRGIFGLGVAIVWSPIFTRLWERSYHVLRIRWTLDAESAKLGLIDPSTKQKPMQEVSSNDNPNNPKYIWKYDELLQRKVRVYVTACRPVASLLLVPLTWVILLVVMIIFSLFAIWGGTYMMVLPSCADCNEMVESAALNETWFYAQDPRPVTPYDRYRFKGAETFFETRTFDEYIFSFSDSFINVSADEVQCLPKTCEQSPTYLLWGTCWENPSGLPWEGTPLFSFIIFTALIMRPITGVLIALYEAMVRCITKLENWETLREYNEAYLTRRFTALWINLYWFNMMLVFIITRFGPSINEFRYERCSGVSRQFFPDPTNTTDLFDVVPAQHSLSTPAAEALVDLLVKIPGAEFGSSVGIWNPKNPLVAGLWVGCLFDLILTQSSFIMILMWPGFFLVAGARCCRSRADCRNKCCVCSRVPLPVDEECETVRSVNWEASQQPTTRKLSRFGIPSTRRAGEYTKMDSLLGKKMTSPATEIALARSSQVNLRNVKVDMAETRQKSGSFQATQDDISSAALEMQQVDEIDEPSISRSVSALPLGIAQVTHLRKYDAPALVRQHNLADFKHLSGVLDYPSMVLLTMVVAVFTIFFPFLVIFVTGGVLLEMMANVLGLLGFSRVSIVESSGIDRWTWMLRWTQYAAVPVVMSYFVFTVLEFMECEDVEIVRDIGDGTGIAFCYDPLFDTFQYNHTPFAFMWVFFSIIGLLLFKAVERSVGRKPAVVQAQEDLAEIIQKNSMEVAMVVKGLSNTVVHALEVIYGQLDKNPVFRVLQKKASIEVGGYAARPGDGEVPTNIVLGFMALLLFSTDDTPDDGGTGFHKMLQSACRKKPSRRGSILNVTQNHLQAKRLYSLSEESKNNPQQDARNSDLLSAMANFDCDDSNTIRFAEFANGYRKFRSSGQQLHGVYKHWGAEQWDRRLVTLSIDFQHASEILNPPTEWKIAPEWRRRLDKLAEWRAKNSVAEALKAADAASTKVLDEDGDGRLSVEEASSYIAPMSAVKFKADSQEALSTVDEASEHTSNTTQSSAGDSEVESAQSLAKAVNTPMPDLIDFPEIDDEEE